MEGEEEDGEGNPGVPLYVACVEGALIGRLVYMGVEIEKLIRKCGLAVHLTRE